MTGVKLTSVAVSTPEQELYPTFHQIKMASQPSGSSKLLIVILLLQLLMISVFLGEHWIQWQVEIQSAVTRDAPRPREIVVIAKESAKKLKGSYKYSFRWSDDDSGPELVMKNLPKDDGYQGAGMFTVTSVGPPPTKGQGSHLTDPATLVFTKDTPRPPPPKPPPRSLFDYGKQHTTTRTPSTARSLSGAFRYLRG